MLSLSPELHQQCIDIFLQCYQFESKESLASLFTDELSVFTDQLIEIYGASDRNEKIVQFLIEQHFPDGRPILPTVVLMLRKGYFPGDVLYSQLGEIYSSIYQQEEIKFKPLPTKNEEDILKQARGLYIRLRNLFIKLNEFESFERLQSMFLTPELIPFRIGLKNGSSIQELVDLNLNYLIEQHITGNQPLLPIFLSVLRDRYLPGNQIRDEVEQLYNDIQSAMLAPNKNLKVAVQRKQVLFELLTRLDFREQVQIVKQLIDAERIASFIIHGGPDYGQKTLAYRLTHLKPEWENGQRIIIDAGAKGNGRSSFSLWRQIALRFGLPTMTNSSELSERIICWWQTQDVIIVIDTIDYIPTALLSKWIDEFWVPLASLAYNSQNQTLRKTHLVLFLVDYRGKLSKTGLKTNTKITKPYNPNLPILLPSAKKFPPKELKIWFDLAADIIPSSLKFDLLLSSTDNGIPDLVYEKICEYCGINWEGELMR